MVGVGSILVIPTIAKLLSRCGTQIATCLSVALLGGGALMVGLAPTYSLFLLALVIGGAGSAALESCASTSASRIEQAYKRPMMPAFIGMMAVGSVVGALFGACLLSLHISLESHLVAGSVIVLISGAAASTKLLPSRLDATVGAHIRIRPKLSWRLAGICSIILVSVVEGSAFAFATVYMTDDLRAGAGVGALAITAHMIGTAVAQVSGDWLRVRYSPATLVRVLVILGSSIMGGALCLNSVAPALFGFFAFGASVAFVYPAGLSAAADTQATPASGITVAQTVRYIAAFGAAPLLGALVDATSLVVMFTVAIVFSVVTVTVFAGFLGNEKGLPPRIGGELPRISEALATDKSLLNTGTVMSTSAATERENSEGTP
jgi:MFS family permease